MLVSPRFGMSRAAQMPGRMTMNGMKIFGNAPMIGAPGGVQVARAHGPLHLGEVRRPVAEAEDERLPEDDAHPVADRVGFAVGRDRRPGPGLGPVVGEVGQPRHDLVRPARGRDRDHRDRDQVGDDHEELHHLVVDRAGESAGQDVGQKEDGRQHHALRQGPSQRARRTIARLYRLTPAIRTADSADVEAFSRWVGLS